MKKTVHIAKANILRHKGASISLFIIILVVALLATLSLSVLLGLKTNYIEVMESSDCFHSMFLLTRDIYNASFEDIIKNDSRVCQYEITQVLSPSSVVANLWGDGDIRAVIFSLDEPLKISSPKIVKEDASVPRDKAIYLSGYAKGLGYEIGDEFTMLYRNKPISFIIAGFFESNELLTINMTSAMRFFVPGECYEALQQKFDSCVWITARFFDIGDAPSFNRSFASEIDVELIDFPFAMDIYAIQTGVMSMIAIFPAILMAFAVLIALIAMFAIRFRVTSNIEDSMHEIGVLKASGYTNSQIIACYIMEYAAVSIPAALLGAIGAVPLLPFVRQAVSSVSGILWSFKTNLSAGIVSALVLAAVLLSMVLRASSKIKELAPVTALRGGIAANSFRRNYFSLGKGIGSVHTRLGLKNMFVFAKSYAMVGMIIAIMSFASVIVTVLYNNLVIDHMAFARMAGFEQLDIQLIVTRHTDADALASELEQMPEIRKTTMLDYLTVQIGAEATMSQISSDFAQMEGMFAHDGRFPIYDNEVAITKVFADEMGKEIGDSINVTSNGVSQEYIITGFYPVMSNGGRVAAMSLDGYQRLDPNYKRATINIYLSEGVSTSEFYQMLEQTAGVANIYKHSKASTFAGSKAVAEEKISNYIEHYDVDSVEYAVIYNGDIILSGSSAEYQIEKILDFREFAKSQLGAFAQAVTLVVEVIMLISLLTISMIIAMATRSIVTKRYREFGTLKALGYTTKQLARQLAISFLPCAAIGVILGCAIGAVTASPALTALLASAGAYGSMFAVNPLIVIVIGAIFLLAAFAVADISAKSIKSITAYELISERPVAKKMPSSLALRKHAAILVACLMLLSTGSNLAHALNMPEPDGNAPKPPKLYGIGSVSKVFTAAAVMKLVDDEKIDLDSPIADYIAGFRLADPRYINITPRMLLNHSSGLMGSTFDNAFLLGDSDTVAHDHFLEQIKLQTLKHEPGDRSIYCNDGFMLAEILIERASGMSYTEYIEQNFLSLMNIEGIKTPQSDFSRSNLAGIYIGNNRLQHESLGSIGSGGIYATMEGLCRYATVFMSSADESVLSKNAVDEMAKSHHMNEMVSPEADNMIRYGLGWDCVETYPFSRYGIKALSKSGDTEKYHTNLTVLPEYNLAAAVSSSGSDSHAQIIAQEIITEVLKEEGLIPREAAAFMPEINQTHAKIPESLKAYEGIYNAGFRGTWKIEFTDGILALCPIMVSNERPLEYFYNANGEFVSTNNDYIGISGSKKEGARGVSVISFAEGKYLLINTYESLPGLGMSAFAMPFAQRLEDSEVSALAVQAWTERNDKEYLLVSEKYTSLSYITHAMAKTLTDNKTYGYVGMGIYKGGGAFINNARIIDAQTALGFQDIPTMAGRDTNNLYITNQYGIEYLNRNDTRYIDAEHAKKLLDIGDIVALGSETVWIDIDSEAAGHVMSIETPHNGAWFVYDAKMNCIATSLEAQMRNTITLPVNGRLAFAGETGAIFVLNWTAF